MVNCPEIDFPGAYERYHGKGVLFRVKVGTKVESRRGRLSVGEDSRWMRIDTGVEGAANLQASPPVPLTQEMVESLRPATKLVQEQYGNTVSFVLPQILSLPPEAGVRQRAA